MNRAEHEVDPSQDRYFHVDLDWLDNPVDLDRIAEAGFLRAGNFQLDSGPYSRIKAEFDAINEDPELLESVADSAADLIVATYDLNEMDLPTLIGPVPSGPNQLAHQIAERLRSDSHPIAVVHTRKVGAAKPTQFILDTSCDTYDVDKMLRRTPDMPLNLLTIEDVASTYGSARRNFAAINSGLYWVFGRGVAHQAMFSVAERLDLSRDSAGDPLRMSLFGLEIPTFKNMPDDFDPTKLNQVSNPLVTEEARAMMTRGYQLQQ